MPGGTMNANGGNPGGGNPGGGGIGPQDPPIQQPSPPGEGADRARGTDETQWRARALAAEELAAALNGEVQACRAARAKLEAQVTRARLERELAAANAVDIEAALALVESALPGTGDAGAPASAVPGADGAAATDPAAVVAALRARKPFLFKAGTGESANWGTNGGAIARPGAMAGFASSLSPGALALGPDGSEPVELAELARRARDDGDARAMARYLRARRRAN